MTEQIGGTATPLMVVEDSDEDFEALSRIFRKLGFASRVQRCINGEECLEFLSLTRNPPKDSKQTLPGLILLDLNLPGMDGCATLLAIKNDPHLKMIPVTIFTTSASARDVADSYAAGANAYVLKPLDYDDLTETVRSITDFWLRTVVLPTTF